MRKEEIISGVKENTCWWIGQRRKKLEEQLSETMSVNPFLMPFLFDYHNLNEFKGLADLIIASHLMTGHNTGFGKLIDEKILPNVFGAEKLDASFRRKTAPFANSCFDEIDHIITRASGKKDLLSLKAGKWTIQLTMAVQLNAAFKEIIQKFPNVVDNIVVGVFYGKKTELTDKYDILRGINRGANHNVYDLTNYVSVYAGREFWAWLNDGEDETQHWVLDGIQAALKQENIHQTASSLLGRFKDSVALKYEPHIKHGDKIDWHKFLTLLNG